jgi:acyl-CoA thioester hydrolase
MTQAPGCFEHRERVLPDWIDETGALRPAYAVVIFDHAIDVLYEGIGLGLFYRRATTYSTFTLETHTLLERPVPAGAEARVRSHLLEVDAKRMRIAQEMFLPVETRRVALMEQLALHVDLATRRSAPFPPERLAQIRAAMAGDAATPRPRDTGRAVGLSAARASMAGSE